MSETDAGKLDPDKMQIDPVASSETVEFSASANASKSDPDAPPIDEYSTQYVERVLPKGGIDQSGIASAATNSNTHNLPTDIPGFVVEAELGRGAFGVVYRARDELLDRRVAIKKPLINNPAHRQRYIDEARKAVKLDHPSIVPIYQVGMTINNEPFVVQKLIQGSTLREILKKGDSRLPLVRTVAIMRQVCLAVDAAHRAGIVHRDLKPENFLVEPEGRVYVADFGLAVLEDDEQNKKGMEVAGTPLYMSPEQFSGRVEWLDGRSDIWALGVILYELLSGKTPFSGTTLDELRDQIKNKDPRPIHQRDPKVPSAFDALFRKCCAKNVGERYASVREIIAELDIITEKLPTSKADRVVMNSKRNDERRPRPIATREFSLSEPNSGQGDDGLHVENDFEFTDGKLQVDTRAPMPILGEYQIEEFIGAGGMGQVFRARHRTMDRQVAIKILPRSLSDDDIAVKRFYTEVRATARLMHPNIVTAFDAGCYRVGDKPVHYLVMELIHGELLSQRVNQNGPMNAAEVVEVLKQSASALEYAHAQGIVHRDIKPSNMMITPAGVLKILDFGLAVLRGHLDKQAAKESQLVGTVEFMSPEQINAPETVDHRSDLYSLGATVFYLLTGRPMFHGEAVQTAMAHINTKPPALYEVRSDVDIRLDSVFQSLVSKAPEDRFQSASGLTEKLIAMNLIERPVIPTRVRGAEHRLPKLGFEHPTSAGLVRSTSHRPFAAVGIELGMILSRVSYIDSEHKVEEVQVDGESAELRNMLFSDGENIGVGAVAVDHRASNPNQIFYGMQRWYGLPLVERPFGGRQVPPEVLVACVIRQLTVAARHRLPNASHAVVTVPACYDQMHRLSTKTACSIAGVEVLQLLDKPLAATLAHVEIATRLAQAAGNASEYRKTFLIAMLNGTACEVSVVSVNGLVIQMLSSVGDWKRGATRWHDRATKRLATEVEKRLGDSAREDLNIASRLQRTMEKAFDRLQISATVPFVFETPGGKVEGQLDRERLYDWVGDLENDCLSFAREAIERAKIDPATIDSILLLGDVRWMPVIQRQLSKLVGPKAKLIMLKSNDLARGAAIQAKNIMPPMDLQAPVAHAASSYDLGVIIQEDGSRISQPKVLIGKDTPTPAYSSRTLRFTLEGKEQPQLQFVEGSRLGASTWSRLGRLDLKTCFPGRFGSDPLQLRIDIDNSGIWSGSLTWLAGNKQLSIPPLIEPLMDVVSTKRWRDWLESLMLCNS